MVLVASGRKVLVVKIVLVAVGVGSGDNNVIDIGGLNLLKLKNGLDGFFGITNVVFVTIKPFFAKAMNNAAVDAEGGGSVVAGINT